DHRKPFRVALPITRVAQFGNGLGALSSSKPNKRRCLAGWPTHGWIEGCTITKRKGSLATRQCGPSVLRVGESLPSAYSTCQRRQTFRARGQRPRLCPNRGLVS